VGQELVDGVCAEFRWVAHLVEQNEMPDPADVRRFRVRAVVPGAK
jgi:hypothetical protein